MLKTIKIKKVGFAFIITGKQTFSDHVNHHSSSMITLRNHTAVHEWDQYQCREADNHSGNWDRMLLMCTMTRQDNTTINVCLCHQLLIMLLYLESRETVWCLMLLYLPRQYKMTLKSDQKSCTFLWKILISSRLWIVCGALKINFGSYCKVFCIVK